MIENVLQWHKYANAMDSDNTWWCAKSCILYQSWRLRPVLKNDMVMWLESHDDALEEYWGSNSIPFRSVNDAMANVQDKHDTMYQESCWKKLRDFASKFIDPQSNTPGIVAEARAALGLENREGESK